MTSTVPPGNVRVCSLSCGVAVMVGGIMVGGMIEVAIGSVSVVTTPFGNLVTRRIRVTSWTEPSAKVAVVMSVISSVVKAVTTPLGKVVATVNSGGGVMVGEEITLVPTGTVTEPIEPLAKVVGMTDSVMISTEPSAKVVVISKFAPAPTVAEADPLMTWVPSGTVTCPSDPLGRVVGTTPSVIISTVPSASVVVISKSEVVRRGRILVPTGTVTGTTTPPGRVF